LRKRTRSQGPFLRRNYPASTVVRPCPTPARSAATHSVEAATSDRAGLPRLPASPFRRAAPTTPMDRNGCMCRLLPRPPGLPRCSGGSASISSLSRPAQASLALRPAGSVNRPTAAFVTRLRPGQSPSQAARQLPDQSTILWVESSSTGDTRLRGAQNKDRTPLGFWQENVDFGDFQASLRMTGPRPSDAVTPRARGSTAERLGSY